MLKLVEASLFVGAINAAVPERARAAAIGIFVSAHSNIKRWRLSRDTESTPATKIMIYEVEKPATFSQIFSPLVREEIDELCLTRNQINRFCEKYHAKLRVTTFFLTKKKIWFLKRCWRWLMHRYFGREIKNAIFVLAVTPCGLSPNGSFLLREYAAHFESDAVWGQGHLCQVVVRASRPLPPTA